MTTDIHKRLPPHQDWLISSLVEFERSLPIAKMEQGFTVLRVLDKEPPTHRYIIPNAADAKEDVIETTDYALDDLQRSSHLYIGRMMTTSIYHDEKGQGRLVAKAFARLDAWIGQGRLLPKAFEYYDAVHEMPEGLIQEKRNLVDTKVSQVFPVAIGHLKKAYADIWVEQPEGNWSTVALNCQNALRSFADKCYHASCASKVNKQDPSAADFEERLDIVIRAHISKRKGEKLRDLLTSFNKYANAYLLARRHDPGTTQAEAKRCVLYTYLLISEIYELLHPPVETL